MKILLWLFCYVVCPAAYICIVMGGKDVDVHESDPCRLVARRGAAAGRWWTQFVKVMGILSELQAVTFSKGANVLEYFVVVSVKL